MRVQSLRSMASRSTSRFPGFDHLFWVSQAFSNDDFVAELDLEGVTQVDALRGAVALKKAVARWAMGASRPSDAVWTQDVGLPLLRHPFQPPNDMEPG